MAAITLHVLPPSHPCKAAQAALAIKGLEYERVDLVPGPHVEQMREIYGEGNTTVPGMLVDGERVHGSIAIMAALEELAPNPPLYPAEIADAVREAELWGDRELQDLGRRMSWGSMHFRPEAMGTFAGGGPLDGAGTDFAMRFIRGSWKYHGISCELLESDLQGIPAKIDHVDALVADGIIGGESANAADLQIGSTLRVLLTIGDLRPMIAGRPAEQVALKWFPDYQGEVPAGAFPPGWLPAS
ncbi:MAG: hypothetical protein QOG62_823 [Thermoleophilaceae bacterium]|jgi:glutathione S-transferase|nr:hypothetical protein [Thermoleophilaceae bacterium]